MTARSGRPTAAQRRALHAARDGRLFASWWEGDLTFVYVDRNPNQTTIAAPTVRVLADRGWIRMPQPQQLGRAAIELTALGETALDA